MPLNPALHVACMRYSKNGYKIRLQSMLERDHLEEKRHRSEGNIKMDIKELGWCNNVD
jgi:hypothetical protein